MRNSFAQTLGELAAGDDRIWLLTADLGFSVLEPFAVQFPERYVNVGVAEQNMAGIAAGLAMSAKTVFIYSIANFPTMRCLEQIRNDICYHNANVKIVAVGGGLAYGPQGYTHHGVEDVAVLRVLPNMTVFCPGDPWETRRVTELAVQTDGPCYLRLGKANEKKVHQSAVGFAIGQAVELAPGTDVTLASTGGMLASCVEAREELRQQGLRVRLLSLPTVSPLDQSALLRAQLETGGIVTVEEHGPGGLYSMVAEFLLTTGHPTRLRGLHLPREAVKVAGSQAELHRRFGLDPAGISRVVREFFDQGVAQATRR